MIFYRLRAFVEDGRRKEGGMKQQFRELYLSYKLRFQHLRAELSSFVSTIKARAADISHRIAPRRMHMHETAASSSNSASSAPSAAAHDQATHMRSYLQDNWQSAKSTFFDLVQRVTLWARDFFQQLTHANTHAH